MKSQNKSRQMSLAFIIFCVVTQQAYAGIWDDVKSIGADVTKQVVGDTINEVVGDNPEPTPKQQPQPVQKTTPSHTYQKPLYDQALVADTQSQLNRLGYNVGAVDGLYGNGTKRAIERFQQDQHLAINGKPSANLLSRMKVSAPIQVNVAANAGNKPHAMNSAPASTTEAEKSNSNTTMGKIPDVVGLRLGITVDEAVEVLRARNPDYVIEKVMFSERHKSPEKKLMGRYFVDSVSYVKAALPDNSETISVVFPAYPAESLSQGIDRIVTYGSKGPLKQNVINAIHGKYGDRESLFWQFDKNYQLIEHDDSMGVNLKVTCGAVAIMNFRRGTLSNSTAAGRECQIFLNIGIGETDDIVNNIRTTLIDAPKSHDNMAKTHQYIADSKESDKKKHQTDAAKRSTPDF